MKLLNELNSIAPCYVKGGAVRDKILGETPKDYDFLFLGDIDEIKEKLQESFDVVWAYKNLNIVGFARPGERYDAAVVDSIDRIDKRADYTLNALLMDVNGDIKGDKAWIADCEAKTLKMTAEANLRKDAIRAVRGVRLKHSHGLKVEPATYAVIEDIIPKMVLFDPHAEYGVSRNRLRKEIKKCNNHAKKELLDLGLEIPLNWL